MSVVVDMNNVEICKGAEVIVHQEEGPRKAMVVEPFPENPTVNRPGWWVDIEDDNGIEGMMSYILEVVV